MSEPTGKYNNLHKHYPCDIDRKKNQRYLNLQFFTFEQQVKMKIIHAIIYRSSHRRCSVKKGVFKNFAKFTGKHLCQSLFFNKVAGLRRNV